MVPASHRGRTDDDEDVLPAREPSARQDPKTSISVAEARPQLPCRARCSHAGCFLVTLSAVRDSHMLPLTVGGPAIRCLSSFHRRGQAKCNKSRKSRLCSTMICVYEPHRRFWPGGSIYGRRRCDRAFTNRSGRRARQGRGDGAPSASPTGAASGPAHQVINGNNPATIIVGNSCSDLGATITAPLRRPQPGWPTTLYRCSNLTIQFP
jgi:hypothetical protein